MKKADIDKIRKYGRRTILETVRSEDEGSDVRYQIVQYTLPVFHGADALAIEFDNNGSYIYSAVYTNPRRHFQPVYQVAQRLIDAYFAKRGLDSALVLGCAGCTIPRFLVLHYPHSRVVGVASALSLSAQTALSMCVKTRTSAVSGWCIPTSTRRI